MALLFRSFPFSWLREKIKRTTPWIRVVAEADIVGDIRGGDSFSDIYGLKRYLISSLPVIAVLWIRGDITLFPQTYGPYKTWAARCVARYILRRASSILARDLESMETVRGLVGFSKELRFCPDVAFALDAVLPSQIKIDPPLIGSPGCVIGVNVNGLMYYGGYNRENMFGLKLDYREFLPKLLEALLRDESARVLLVPHTFAPPGDVESDPDACRDVVGSLAPALRTRVHLVAEEYDHHQIKGIIGVCDFFVGSRMHSCIAALSQGIPTVGIAYSKKFKGVFESIGVSDWIVDARSTDIAAAVTKVVGHYKARSEVRKPLAEKVCGAKASLREAFAAVV
jgi:polysaccharide pyruvyl transferase WcaK-like protein